MNHTSGRGRRRIRLLLASFLLVVAAGCGSSKKATTTTVAPGATGAASTQSTAASTSSAAGAGSSSTAGGSGPGAAGMACVGSGDGKGSAIKVGSIQTDSSASAGFPEISKGAQACFDAINATGGVKGHKIDFQPCNDNADAVKGEACARDLIDAKAVAVLGGICFSCFSGPVVDVLGKANVPYVGGLPVLPSEYKQENFLPITNAGGSASLYANTAFILKAAKDKGVTADVVEVNASVGEINPTLENQVKKLGANYAGRVNFDPASADLSSVAQQAIDKKPNFVSVQTDGPNTVKIVTALRSQGYAGGIVILGTAADPQSLAGMGAAAEGAHVAAFFPDLANGATPDAKKYQADMKASGADPAKTLAVTGYAAAFVTAQALANVAGDITAESFKAALLKLDGIKPLFNGQLSYKNTTADFPRTFYFTAYDNIIAGGKITPTGQAFNFVTGAPIG